MAYQLALGQQFGHPKQLTSTLQGTCANVALVVCQHPQGSVLTTGAAVSSLKVTNSVVLNVYLLFDWAPLCLLLSTSWACSYSWVSSIFLNLRERFLSLLRSVLYKRFFKDRFARNRLADVNSFPS